ncbi:PAS domain S-box protein [Flavobacterium cupreum]|uniref:histidine kinase n=1 Tax=Flavobacterium cupreum TaxID=2133766 RepID=A0A434ACJ1_9FLAO|nr:PAS domain-containing protein [Flavobacterium cupreum]RUT72087.1 PAS domain S-box protein [Flavobacterium cupreum]
MNSNLHFLSAGGEMGHHIRTKDWSHTPVGDPSIWPQSLRTALSIILNSRFPMFLFWGKDLVCFYNDAYRPSLGNDGKHPSILGMPGASAWPEIWEFIKPLIDDVLQKKEASWHEDQLLPIFRNGKMEDVYWTFSYSPVIDETENPAGVFVTCSETTEKVRLIDNLSESHKQLEFAIEAAELGTYDYSPATGKFTANNRLKDWFGLPHQDEIYLQNAIDAIMDSDRERVQDAITEVLRPGSGGKYDLYYTIVHPLTFDKKVVHAKGKATFDAQGTALRLDGTLQDISRQVHDSNEKDKALNKASHAAQHLNLALEAGALGSYELDIATGTIQCSLQCKINFGRKPWESLSYNEFLDMVLDEDRPAMREAFNNAVASKTVYDATYRINTSEGIRWIHASAMPVVDRNGKVTGMAGVTANITELKNSQLKITAALEQTALSREKLNIVIEASELGTWELDLKTGEIETSSRFSEIFTGTIQQDFTLAKTRLQIHPEDMEKRNQAHKEARETGKLYFTGRIIWPDSSIHWIESKGKVFYDRDGTPEHMIGTVQDITEEKQKQQILHKSEQKFRLLADSMAQHVWTSDSEGNLNYFNQSVYDYSGLSSEQLVAGGWIQIVHPDDRQINIEAWTKAVSEGTDFILEHRFRNAAGDYRWQLSRAIPQRDAEGKIQMWVGTSTDIQEQRSFTDELELRVQERTLQMQQKNVELERMNR